MHRSRLASFARPPLKGTLPVQVLLRARPNPSVKGTSCGKPQTAPYVER